MNECGSATVLLCSLMYHCAGPWRGRQLRAGLRLTEYPGQKGSKETDDFNAEGMQVTQVKKGF